MMTMNGIKNAVIILMILIFSLPIFASQPYDYLKDYTEDDLDAIYEQLPENERDNMVGIISEVFFSRVEEVFSNQFQCDLMEKKFETLDEIISNLRYYRVWDLSYQKVDFFGEYPFEIYKILKDNIFPSQIMAYVLFDHETKTYQILGYSKILLEQFNQLVSISFSSSDEAVLYAIEVVSLMLNYDILDKDESEIGISSPKIIFETEHSYAIEMYGKLSWGHRWFEIFRLIVIVDQEGHLLIFEQEMCKY